MPVISSKRLLLRICGAVAIAALIFLGISFSNTISPADQTVTRVLSIRSQVLEFARRNNRLPVDLNELPRAASDHLVFIDAWQRPFLYSSDAAGIVIVESLGKDGVPGGERANRDIVAIFQSRSQDGRWVDNSEGWITNPRHAF